MVGEWRAMTGAVAHDVLTSPDEVSRARAKYVVLVVGETIRGLPLPTSPVPQLTEYQSMVCPAGTVPVSVTGSPSQDGEGLACTLVGVPGIAGPLMVKLALEMSKKMLPTASILILAWVVGVEGS